MDYEFFNEDRAHLKQIADLYQKIYEGVLKRVAISMPPRFGKSYITTMFCVFMLANNVSGSVMRNSYSSTLYRKFSYDARFIVKSKKFQEVFPDVKLSDDKANVDGWNLQTAKQVSYFGDGVGGSITGFGCNTLAVLDDPIRNMEEGLSEVIKDKVWNWYNSTHKSRLEKDCPEIHIATRWAKDDPIGRLVEQEYFDESISIPAIDENGESMCPAIKSTKEYAEIRKTSDKFIWLAVFMQSPIDVEGALFKNLNYFKLSELKQKPDGIIAAGDIADKGDDYLSVPIGYVYGNDIYVVDVVFTQDDVEVTEPLTAAKLIEHNVHRATFESNSMGHSFTVHVRQLINRQVRCDISEQFEQKNKETRILMHSGNIKKYFHFRSDYEPGSDYDKFMRQLTSYVRGGKNKHDDAPDSMALMDDVLKNKTEWVF